MAGERGQLDKRVKAREKFGSREREDLVPEAGVEQVQHCMLSAAHIEVDIHPVFLSRLPDKALVVLSVEIPQVIPATARPLGHGVGFPGGGHPIAFGLGSSPGSRFAGREIEPYLEPFGNG